MFLISFFSPHPPIFRKHCPIFSLGRCWLPEAAIKMWLRTTAVHQWVATLPQAAGRPLSWQPWRSLACMCTSHLSHVAIFPCVCMSTPSLHICLCVHLLGPGELGGAVVGDSRCKPIVQARPSLCPRSGGAARPPRHLLLALGPALRT